MLSELLQTNVPEKLKSINVPIILFGAGGKGADALDFLSQQGIYPAGFCDNNPTLHDTEYCGLKVYSYPAIRETFSDYALLITVSLERSAQIFRQLEQQKETHLVIPFCIPFKLENTLYQPDISRIADYEKVYQRLEDQGSKDIFLDFMFYKRTGNGLSLLPKTDGDSFFDEKLVTEREDHIFVDVGAYTGDTLLRFYAFCRGKYQKIVALEPEPVNFQKLQAVVENGRLPSVQMEQIGGWSHKDTLCFFTSKEGSWNANLTKDPVEAHSEAEYIKTEITVNAIDNILDGNPATLIKINAMAADYEILKGCQKTIRAFRPVLMLDYGGAPIDILEIPILLLNLCPDYRLFLRQKTIFGDSKTILYAL